MSNSAKATDPTEGALLAIEEALKAAGATPPSGAAASTNDTDARSAETASADDAKGDSPKSDSDLRAEPGLRAAILPAMEEDLFAAIGRDAKEAREQSRDQSKLRPANDDARAAGDVLRAMQPRARRSVFVWAALAAIVWGGICYALAQMFATDVRLALSEAALSAPTGYALALLIGIPVILIFIAAAMVSRAKELRLVSQSMADVAMKLAQPEHTANDAIVSVSQAVRREVAAMGDGVERALARAAELETMVHNEVSALEQAYDNNEVRIRGLLEELTRQREFMVAQTEQVRTALSTVHGDLNHDITRVADVLTARVSETSDRIARALADKSEEIVITFDRAGDSMVNSITERATDMIERVERTGGETSRAIADASDQLNSSLNLKADRIGMDFAELSVSLSQKMTENLDEVAQTFASKANNVVALMDDRSRVLTNTIVDTSNELAELITVRGNDVNNTLKATGESLVMDLSLRGGDIISRLEKTSTGMTEEIVSRGNKVSESFHESADTLASTIASSGDAVKDMLQARLSAFEEMFTHGGAQLAERIGQDSTTLGTLITRHMTEFDRTVKVYGGELVDRIGARTESLTGAMQSHIENFDGRVTAKTDEITQSLDARLANFAKTLAEGGKEVVGALDTRITGVREMLLGRAEEVTAQIETRTRAATESLNNRMIELADNIKTNAGDAERALTSLSTNVEKSLLTVSAEVARNFSGKADEIALAVSSRAEEMTKALDTNSSTLLSALSEKSTAFTGEVERATQSAVKAIETRGLDFTQTMLNNSEEIARLINDAGVNASTRVDATLKSLHETAKSAVEQQESAAKSAVTEMAAANEKLRTDATSMFERLREGNIMLQEVLAGAQDNMGILEKAMGTRVHDFAKTMREIADSSGAVSGQVAEHVTAFQSVTSRALEELSHLAADLDSHGKTLVDAVNLIDQSNRRNEETLNQRKLALDTLFTTLDMKTDDLDVRLKRFGSVIDESLESASSSARDIAKVLAESSDDGAQQIIQQFERVRTTTEQERKRTVETLQSIYDQASGDTHAIFRETTTRFADVMTGMRQMAAEMQTELDQTRTELRRGILELPQETADSTAQMRRVIVDQIEALAELNRIVARHGRTVETAETRTRVQPSLAAVGGRTVTQRLPRAESISSPPSNFREPPAYREAPATPFAPRDSAPRDLPAQRNDNAMPRRDAPPLTPAPAGAAPARGNWLSDLLHRASRDEGEQATDNRATAGADDAARPERHSIESLDALSVDIARMIDHEAATELWERYNRGERNVFTRRLYTLQGQKTFDDIRKRYRSERDFRTTVDRYIAEFERLLDEVAVDDRGQVVVRTYLTSETGKVYTMLAHAAGRFE